jgi:dihydroorotate dehydrogenase
LKSSGIFEGDAVLYRWLRPLLFAIPAETIHDWTSSGLGLAQRILQRRAVASATSDAMLSQQLWGLQFPNPVGLAAGFDKNGALPHVWAALGFGFAELGTITARAQAGNPKPRLFRLPDQQGLINRLGFNNRGAAAVARELQLCIAGHRPPIPLGINLGKSRDTPIDAAVDDYRLSLAALFDSADYFVINVSSPNTPGLRDLQDEARLGPLLEALQADNRSLAAARGVAPRPLLVKVAPDLSDEGLRAVVSVTADCGGSGLIATNTSIDRSLLLAAHPLAGEAGGLSGAPLRDRATAVIRRLHLLCGGRLPIIGVGGIFSAEDAYAKIRAGASLVQVYTGFVYEGPGLPRRICAGLKSLLARDGFANIAAAIGVEA